MYIQNHSNSYTNIINKILFQDKIKIEQRPILLMIMMGKIFNKILSK